MTSLLLALPLPDVVEKVKELVDKTDIPDEQRPHLMGILHAWPAVCTTRLGRTSMSCHHIHTVHEVPVRKKAYPVPVHKQKIIDDKITRMLDKCRTNRLKDRFYPWAARILNSSCKFNTSNNEQ